MKRIELKVGEMIVGGNIENENAGVILELVIEHIKSVEFSLSDDKKKSSVIKARNLLENTIISKRVPGEVVSSPKTHTIQYEPPGDGTHKKLNRSGVKKVPQKKFTNELIEFLSNLIESKFDRVNQKKMKLIIKHHTANIEIEAIELYKNDRCICTIIEAIEGNIGLKILPYSVDKFPNIITQMNELGGIIFRRTSKHPEFLKFRIVTILNMIVNGVWKNDILYYITDWYQVGVEKGWSCFRLHAKNIDDDEFVIKERHDYNPKCSYLAIVDNKKRNSIKRYGEDILVALDTVRFSTK